MVRKREGKNIIKVVIYKQRMKETHRHPKKIECPYCLKQDIEKWMFPWNVAMHVYYNHSDEELLEWKSRPKFWLRDKNLEEKKEFEKQIEKIRKEKDEW